MQMRCQENTLLRYLRANAIASYGGQRKKESEARSQEGEEN